MTHFNNIDYANFYSTASASGELDGYPFLGQMSVTGEANCQAYNTHADWWSTGRQPGPMVGPHTNFQATSNYGKSLQPQFYLCLTRGSPESIASTTSYQTSTNGYEQPSYPGHCWPVIGQQPQYHHSRLSNQGGSFASTMASETSPVIPIPSSGKHVFSLTP